MGITEFLKEKSRSDKGPLLAKQFLKNFYPLPRYSPNRLGTFFQLIRLRIAIHLS